jgi:signal transduction histidine kinase
VNDLLTKWIQTLSRFNPDINIEGQVNEHSYRDFYLESDINKSKKAAFLFAIPILGFIFNDYAFFGFSPLFFGLLVFRAFLLLVIGFEIAFIGKVKTSRSYDVLVFWSTLCLIIGGGVINLTRPESFVLHSAITIIALFVLYMVVPLKFLYLTILGSTMVVGEVFIIVFLANNSQFSVVYSAVFSLIVAYAIAGLSSRQLYLYRRKTFEEFVHRQALQEDLKKHADHLSEFVELRTRESVEAQKKLLKSERFAAIGELAGMIGHDLRNPLAGIKNASYFLRKKQGSFVGDSGMQMLNTIDKAVEYSNKVVNDLLDYSRDIPLDLEECTPKSLIDYVLLTIKIPKNIKILDHTESSPTIMADMNKLVRVFTNLITNALDAMSQNGGTLEINSHQNGDNLELAFADTGTGMSPEVMEKIFTPLFTTKAQGMGFGLAICKRIIETHGGTIAVESTQKKGTVFTVTLPVSQSNTIG